MPSKNCKLSIQSRDIKVVFISETANLRLLTSCFGLSIPVVLWFSDYLTVAGWELDFTLSHLFVVISVSVEVTKSYFTWLFPGFSHSRNILIHCSHWGYGPQKSKYKNLWKRKERWVILSSGWKIGKIKQNSFRNEPIELKVSFFPPLVFQVWIAPETHGVILVLDKEKSMDEKNKNKTWDTSSYRAAKMISLRNEWYYSCSSLCS